MISKNNHSGLDSDNVFCSRLKANWRLVNSHLLYWLQDIVTFSYIMYIPSHPAIKVADMLSQKRRGHYTEWLLWTESELSKYLHEFSFSVARVFTKYSPESFTVVCVQIWRVIGGRSIIFEWFEVWIYINYVCRDVMLLCLDIYC